MPYLDPTGLAGRIIAGSKDLDIGRKGLATDGEEHAGRIGFEKGIKGLSESFKDTLSRLRNALRTFGMNPIERGLYRQRLINVTEVQKIYLEKQKVALD